MWFINDARMSKKAGRNIDDNILFGDFLKGETKLFDHFFDKYYRGLCVYAYKLVESRYSAEDIVQDFFIKLWERRNNIFIETSVKSYFLRSIHNRCLDFIAHQNVKESHRVYKMNHSSDEELLDYPLLDFELEQRLRKAIDSLPKGIRETFLLSRIEGMTYQEIADKEGVSVKTIEYRISKALSLLRRDLHDYLPLALLLLNIR